MTKQQEQIKKRFENSRFFDKDPRETSEHVDAWNHTHDWFVFKRWPEHNVVLWIDVGYGFYALQDGGNIVGFGKDMIQTKKWVLLGEYYGKNVTLAAVVKGG